MMKTTDFGMNFKVIIISHVLPYQTMNKKLLAFGDSPLLTGGKLNSYLADIDKQAEEMFFRLVKEMAEKQGITEHLKANAPMAWVGTMNNIRSRAEEIVNTELIFM